VEQLAAGKKEVDQHLATTQLKQLEEQLAAGKKEVDQHLATTQLKQLEEQLAGGREQQLVEVGPFVVRPEVLMQEEVSIRSSHTYTKGHNM
jgi:predicted membrane GTPase involved in stress response